jgi:hypothetical protein
VVDQLAVDAALVVLEGVDELLVEDPLELPEPPVELDDESLLEEGVELLAAVSVEELVARESLR